MWTKQQDEVWSSNTLGSSNKKLTTQYTHFVVQLKWKILSLLALQFVSCTRCSPCGEKSVMNAESEEIKSLWWSFSLTPPSHPLKSIALLNWQGALSIAPHRDFQPIQSHPTHLKPLVRPPSRTALFASFGTYLYFSVLFHDKYQSCKSEQTQQGYQCCVHLLTYLIDK